MKTSFIPVCALIVAIIAARPALAQDKPKGRKEALHVASVAAKPGGGVKAAPHKQRWAGLDAITPFEREVIRAYVRNCIETSKERKPNGVPPGLAKKLSDDGLPPGWKKGCVRGEVLPADVHKRCHPLPEELISKLPTPPSGTVLLAVNAKVIRVAYPTYEILDTFDVQ
jgi:hypothetical protein